MPKSKTPSGLVRLPEVATKVARILFGRAFAPPLTESELREIPPYAKTHRLAYPEDVDPLRHPATPSVFKEMARHSALSSEQCAEARRRLLPLLLAGEIVAEKISSHGKPTLVPPKRWADISFSYQAFGRVPPNAADWDDDAATEEVYIHGSLITKHFQPLSRQERLRLAEKFGASRSAKQGIGGRKQKHHWREIWQQIALWAVRGELPETDADLFRKIQDWYPSEYGIVPYESLKKEVGGFLNSARKHKK